MKATNQLKNLKLYTKKYNYNTKRELDEKPKIIF